MFRAIPRWFVATFIFFGWIMFPLGAAAEQACSNEFSKFIGTKTKSSLRGRWKRSSKRIAGAILKESRKQKLDPLLVMAMIEHESKFRPHVRGRHGEIGLMQVKPSTGRWMARKIPMRWLGAKMLKDPALNIRLGTAYLAYVRSRTEGTHRGALLAYNAGVAGRRRLGGRSAYTDTVLRKYVKLASQAPSTQSSCGFSPSTVLGRTDAIRALGSGRLGKKTVRKVTSDPGGVRKGLGRRQVASADSGRTS